MAILSSESGELSGIQSGSVYNPSRQPNDTSLKETTIKTQKFYNIQQLVKMGSTTFLAVLTAAKILDLKGRQLPGGNGDRVWTIGEANQIWKAVGEAEMKEASTQDTPLG